MPSLDELPDLHDPKIDDQVEIPYPCLAAPFQPLSFQVRTREFEHHRVWSDQQDQQEKEGRSYEFDYVVSQTKRGDKVTKQYKSRYIAQVLDYSFSSF